jgi:DNA-binding SARP family transcriptional activator/class 3 adenylate cyclase/Tfp pilus assembly protein PilF
LGKIPSKSDPHYDLQSAGASFRTSFRNGIDALVIPPTAVRVALLLTDIVGSTSLRFELPAAWREAKAEHDAIVAAEIASRGGRIFKQMGDGVFAVFPNADAAIGSAVAAQRRLRDLRLARDSGPPAELMVRMAIHQGEVEPRGDDFDGIELHRLQRLSLVTHGGQILVTDAAWASAAADAGIDVVDLGTHRLRDVPEPQRIFQLRAEGLTAAFPPLATNSDLTARGATVRDPERADLVIRLLGGFNVQLHGRPIAAAAWVGKSRELLQFLATRPGGRSTRDALVDAVWPNERNADRSLRDARHRVREALRSVAPASKFEPVPARRNVEVLQLDSGVWVDAIEFEELARASRDLTDPLPALEAAAALYRGELLPDERYADWAEAPRRHLAELWIDVQTRLGEALLAASRGGDAAAAFQRALAGDPLSERAARGAMAALASSGLTADAIRVFDQLVETLQRELRATPSAETTELARRIREGGTVPSTSASIDPGSFICSHPFPTPARFIGRVAERQRLAMIARSLRDGGQVLMIGGSAGVGKSSLAGELLQQARLAGALCLAGGSFDSVAEAPLAAPRAAFADFLLMRDPADLRADFGGVLRDLLVAVPELRHHAEPTANEIPPGSVNVETVFPAILALISVLAERSPLVLCLEDLHAADEATIRLLGYLAQHARRLRLTIVGTYRADEVASEGALASLLVRLSRTYSAPPLLLEPLDREQTVRLTGVLLAGPPSPELAESVYATTLGNPLFVEQVIATMRDANAVRLQRGVWRSSGRVATPISSIIRDVIGQRLQRVGPRCREMLACMAVVGRGCQHDLIVAALGSTDGSALLADLDEATSANIIRSSAGVYSFRHPLYRETIYGSLTEPRRLELHGRVGAALEELAGARTDDIVAELAYHYSMAGPLRELRPRAVRYALSAAQAAAALSSYREAREHFATARDLIELTPADFDPADRAAAWAGLAYAAHQLAQWDEALEGFRRAMELTDDPARRAAWRGSVAFVLQQVGDTTAATAEADRGLAELDVSQPAAESALARLRLQFQKAFILFVSGQFAELLTLGEAMRIEAETTGQTRAAAWAHSALGMGYAGRGDIDRSLAEYGTALELAQDSGNSVQVATAHTNVGLQRLRGGDFDRARESLDAAMALYLESAAESRAVLTVQALARLELARGDRAEARRIAEHGLELAIESRDRVEAECREVLGVLDSLDGDVDAARANLQRALEIRERVGHVAGIVESRCDLGLALERAGAVDEALAHFRLAAIQAERLGDSPYSLAALRHLGRCLLLQEIEEGASCLHRAMAMAERMPRSIEVAPTVAVAAWAALSGGELETASSLLARCDDLAQTADVARSVATMRELLVRDGDEVRRSAHLITL